MASAPPPPPSLSFTPTPLPLPPHPQTAAGGGGGGWNPLQRASLYVGDLHPDVTEEDLVSKFSAVAPVASLRLCRCLRTGKSLCYAYVNFISHSAACKAMACLNHTELKGKPMRLMWCHRDPSHRKSGLANVFVKNLNPSISSTRLEGIFCQFGTILSCKVAEENGKSKGFGFVQFDSEESAKAAITALHDTMLEGRKLYVSKFVKKSERTAAAEEEKFTNLYVKNLVDGTTEDHLVEMFSRYGKVLSVVVMKDDKGMSRGFGFVNFQSPDDAKKALMAMNGVQLGPKNLFVGRAQKKAERTEILKDKYKDLFNRHLGKMKASNLYVKNLSETIDEKTLQVLFGQFGQITSAKVMRHDNGKSRNFGFVCFSSSKEAMAAVVGLNGTFVGGRCLYVSVAQRKEDRRKELQKYHVKNTPIQSSNQSSSSAVFPQFPPFYFNCGPCPPPIFPLLRQPSLYEHFVANVGFQYPFATKYAQQNFSYDLTRHMYPGNMGIRNEWVYGQSSMTYADSNVRIRELDHGNSGSKKVGFRKKGNKNCEAAEISCVAVPAIQSVGVTSSGNLKKNNENLSCPLVENLQPEHSAKGTGVLLKVKNSDVNKLLINSPNPLAVQDKSVQPLKEANARTSTDAVIFANSKSARCLSY